MSTPLDKILVTLGYPQLTDIIQERVLRLRGVTVAAGIIVLTAEADNRVAVLLANLVDIDALLLEARTNSMAVKLGSMTLDYKFHIDALRLDAAQSINELAQLVGLEVYYNRYSGDYQASFQVYTVVGQYKPTYYGAVQTIW